MVQLDAMWIGPDSDGVLPYKNRAEVVQAQTWYALGGQQGVIDGMDISGVPGQMALSVAAGAALISRRDGSNNAQDMGYLLPVAAATVVPFNPASVGPRNDALVASIVDTTDGPHGTANLDNGGHLIAVPGVSGSATPRTDAQIAAYLGRGGFHRLCDVPIAATDTQINTANLARVSPYNITDSGWINLTPVSGSGTFQYRVKDGDVYFRSSLSGISTVAPNTNSTVLAAGGIPAAYRPGVTVYEAGSSGGSGMELGVFGTDGSISVWNPSYNSVGITVFRISTSWPIG